MKVFFVLVHCETYGTHGFTWYTTQEEALEALQMFVPYIQYNSHCVTLAWFIENKIEPNISFAKKTEDVELIATAEEFEALLKTESVSFEEFQEISNKFFDKILSKKRAQKLIPALFEGDLLQLFLAFEKKDIV